MDFKEAVGAPDVVEEYASKIEELSKDNADLEDDALNSSEARSGFNDLGLDDDANPNKAIEDYMLSITETQNILLEVMPPILKKLGFDVKIEKNQSSFFSVKEDENLGLYLGSDNHLRFKVHGASKKFQLLMSTIQSTSSFVKTIDEAAAFSQEDRETVYIGQQGYYIYTYRSGATFNDAQQLETFVTLLADKIRRHKELDMSMEGGEYTPRRKNVNGQKP